MVLSLIALDTEEDSFLPKPPPQSKTARKEIRHLIPSSSRHVIVTPEMLNEQLDLDSPYNPKPFNERRLEEIASENYMTRKQRLDTEDNLQRRTKSAKFQAIVLNRGYVPLVLRFISWIFAIVALFLAGYITRYSMLGGVDTRPSTVMAFVVNGIAIFYLPLVAKVYPFSSPSLMPGRIFWKSHRNPFSQG